MQIRRSVCRFRTGFGSWGLEGNLLQREPYKCLFRRVICASCSKRLYSWLPMHDQGHHHTNTPKKLIDLYGQTQRSVTCKLTFCEDHAPACSVGFTLCIIPECQAKISRRSAGKLVLRQELWLLLLRQGILGCETGYQGFIP